MISLGGGNSFGEEMRMVFSETGLLSKSPDFEYRAEQQQMAGEVAEALEGERSLVVEAGTVPGGAGKRCNTDDRLARLATTGGSPQCETAVINALRYLKKNQHKEGFWGEEHCCGITGLALLAYLGHCETPISEEFGEVVFNATVYLIDRAIKNRGRIFDDRKGPWCYEHAIATYALCESYLFSRSFGYQVPNLKKVVQEAVQWIIDSQNSVGSWGYRYGGGGRYDTSITAWHLQALKVNRIEVAEARGYRQPWPSVPDRRPIT
ncbi:hypothetical protein N9111_01125 [bacterium]|nr:hypothetical protein [bacterium]